MIFQVVEFGECDSDVEGFQQLECSETGSILYMVALRYSELASVEDSIFTDNN